jgi:hypothetical protein
LKAFYEVFNKKESKNFKKKPKKAAKKTQEVQRKTNLLYSVTPDERETSNKILKLLRESLLTYIVNKIPKEPRFKENEKSVKINYKKYLDVIRSNLFS